MQRVAVGQLELGRRADTARGQVVLALGLHLEIEHPALGFLVLGLGLAQADLELLHRGARRIELGLGLGERQLVGLRIEAHEHLALRDRGMVANGELGDAAQHLAGDLGDVGLDVSVLGRGIAPARAARTPARPGSRAPAPR